MRKLTSLSLVAIAAAGLATPSLAAKPMAADTDMGSVTPAKYVAKAGASDKFEITEAQMMVGSSNPDIKSFAQKMITDHNKSTMMVKDAARKDGVTLKAPMLEPKQVKMVSALRAAKGKARDALYIQQQLPSHQEALTLQQTEAQSGQGNLMRTAGQIVPVVQSHIDMLNQMNGKTGM